MHTAPPRELQAPPRKLPTTPAAMLPQEHLHHLHNLRYKSDDKPVIFEICEGVLSKEGDHVTAAALSRFADVTTLQSAPLAFSLLRRCGGLKRLCYLVGRDTPSLHLPAMSVMASVCDTSKNPEAALCRTVIREHHAIDSILGRIGADTQPMPPHEPADPKRLHSVRAACQALVDICGHEAEDLRLIDMLGMVPRLRGLASCNDAQTSGACKLLLKRLNSSARKGGSTGRTPSVDAASEAAAHRGSSSARANSTERPSTARQPPSTPWWWKGPHPPVAEQADDTNRMDSASTAAEHGAAEEVAAEEVVAGAGSAHAPPAASLSATSIVEPAALEYGAHPARGPPHAASPRSPARRPAASVVSRARPRGIQKTVGAAEDVRATEAGAGSDDETDPGGDVSDGVGPTFASFVPSNLPMPTFAFRAHTHKAAASLELSNRWRRRQARETQRAADVPDGRMPCFGYLPRSSGLAGGGARLLNGGGSARPSSAHVPRSQNDAPVPTGAGRGGNDPYAMYQQATVVDRSRQAAGRGVQSARTHNSTDPYRTTSAAELMEEEWRSAPLGPSGFVEIDPLRSANVKPTRLIFASPSRAQHRNDVIRQARERASAPLLGTLTAETLPTPPWQQQQQQLHTDDSQQSQPALVVDAEQWLRARAKEILRECARGPPASLQRDHRVPHRPSSGRNTG